MTGTRPRLLLTGKLALLVAGAAVLAAFLLAFVVAPRTRRVVATSTEPLVMHSTAAMRKSAHEAARTSADALTTLIEHTSATRRATLQDLPLELYGGDPSKIAAAIERQDTALSARLVENVGRLATEMDARAQARIDAEAAALAAQQRALAAGIAADVQAATLGWLAGVIVLLLALLAWAVHCLVVRPVRALEQAAAAVAAGNLDVELQSSGEDEVARLVRAFGSMVTQLRLSRTEVERQRTDLARLNAGLEAEVTKKTAALQQALDRLQATQKDLVLAERMASVGTLAGGIAHEFNNLAGGIRGCARELLAHEQDTARREPLEVIARAAERAIDVTDKLLRFARPRAPGTATLDVVAIVREALALVEPQARQQGVRTRVVAGAPLLVRGDGGALHQVFINLLSNALHAMPGGGDLLVEVAREGGDAVLAVRDSGVGIAPADMDRIFDPFFTTRASEAATPGRGAGLGLAVTYGIVQAHGGSVRVASTQGQGATFTVRLPLANTPSAPEAAS
jgi:two-component system NtrC family sensor kinase